jgi:hypothetical protein
MAAPERPILHPDHAEPTLACDAKGPPMAAAAEIEGILAFAYLCACGGGTCPCVLGRAPLKDLNVPTSWRYYNGESWGSYAQAQVLFQGAPMLSVSYNMHIQRYIALYSAPFSTQVKLRTAKERWGPWSEEIDAFSAQPAAKGFPYGALLHPEYDRQNGRFLYVTYYRETGPFQGEMRLVEETLRWHQ